MEGPGPTADAIWPAGEAGIDKPDSDGMPPKRAGSGRDGGPNRDGSGIEISGLYADRADPNLSGDGIEVGPPNRDGSGVALIPPNRDGSGDAPARAESAPRAPVDG